MSDLLAADGFLDALSWAEQLQFLLNTDDRRSQRLVLYTMSPERLLNTAILSDALYPIVLNFLNFLRDNDPEEDELSDDGSAIGMDTEPETALPLPPRHKLAGLADLPTEVSLNLVDQLRFFQKANLCGSCVTAACVVAESLQHAAARILHRFKLDFASVRLMQTVTGTAISGSAVTALVHPTFDPGDLDFIAPHGIGLRVVGFLQGAAKYRIIADSSDYLVDARFRTMWTLMLGDSLKINVIEASTPNPLDCVTTFHMTCVYGAWFADIVWHAYAGLTERGTAITTPARFPIADGVHRHRAVWKVLHKYMVRGFTVCLNELDEPHACGVHLDCPATPRRSTDRGCSVSRFPVWAYSGDAPPLIPTSWSMGGTGCTKGIRCQDGETITSSSYVTVVHADACVHVRGGGAFVVLVPAVAPP
ncbi:hypothetical protein DFH06DRAFT_1147297 [Mycena polygramma]|nr:hypothetical protein DFH06DRAFT_1147297 [Mycena polygramma]